MKVVKKQGRKYYKYSKDTPDAHKVGTPVVKDGILSGLGAASYYFTHLPFSVANNWEIVWKGTTPATFPSYCNLFTLDCSTYGFLAYFNSSTMRVHFSSNRSSWDIASNLEVITVQPNTLYWFKFEYTGTEYIIHVSYDGVEWEERVRIANATRLPYTCDDLYIGYRKAYTGEFWPGTIDLNEMYVKMNGKIVWRGMRAFVSTEEDYDFYKDEVEYYAPIEDKEKYYVQDEYKRLRLYDTTNRSYIDTNNHFIVNSVTAWSTTQIYTLQPNIVANKLRIRVRSDYIQANAGWRCFLIARFKNGSTQSFYKDWGYNVMPNGTYFMDLNTNQEVSHITIYAYCYRSTNSYCYGSINIAIDYSTLVETTKEKAIIIKKDKEVIVNAIGAYRKPKQLAEGFLQLEHIQCNGNQYIFTDYYPKLPSTKIRYICEFMNTPDQCLWCARGATTTTLTNTMFNLAGGLRFDYNATTYQTSACRNTQHIYEIVQDGVNLYVNSALKYTCTLSTFNCDSPLQFFASYHAGIGANLGYFAFLKCYLIEIYENNVLVRRYVPCERVIDKVYGLYDTVNNAFFSNSWSGYNFTRGDYIYEDSDVNDFTIYNPKAYFEATSV